MALINCPDCKKEVSDRSKECPHCGFPIALESGKRDTRLSQKDKFHSQVKKPSFKKYVLITSVLLVLVFSSVILFLNFQKSKPFSGKYACYGQTIHAFDFNFDGKGNLTSKDYLVLGSSETSMIYKIENGVHSIDLLPNVYILRKQGNSINVFPKDDLHNPVMKCTKK